MTQDEKDTFTTDLNAAIVLLQAARGAVQVDALPLVRLHVRGARTLLVALLDSLPDPPPPVDNSAPSGG